MRQSQRRGASAATVALLSLLLSVVFQVSVSGQEVNGNGRAVVPLVGPPQTPTLEHRSILLDIDSFRAPSSRDNSLVDELAPEERPPASLVHSYRGIQAIVTKRLLGYYRRLFSSAMRTRWNESNDTIFDLERRFAQETAAEEDLSNGGRWWDRTWRQSLVPSRGGAPAQPLVITLGTEVDALRADEVSLTTEGKIRLGRFSLFLDDDRVYERLGEKARDLVLAVVKARPDTNVPRPSSSTADRPVKAMIVEESRIDMSVGLAEDDAEQELTRVLAGTGRQRVRKVDRYRTPRGNLFTGNGWNLSIHPSLSLRLPTSNDLTQACSNVSVEFDLNLFPGEARQQWGLVSVELQASPNTRIYSAVALFEILRW